MTHAPETIDKIYKIFLPSDWKSLDAAGATHGSALDQADGFLHFSTEDQLRGTLDAHFKDAGPLILAEIPLASLSDRPVKWEVSRNGALFPHLYGLLQRTDIERHWSLHPDPSDRYELPDF